MIKTSQERHLTRFEKIPTKIFTKSFDASKAVAKEIATAIREKTDRNELCVLGLATGKLNKKIILE